LAGGKKMTAKEYLQQAFYIDRKINLNLQKVEEMKRALYGKAVSYTNGKVKSATKANNTECTIMRVLEYEEQINAETDKLVDLRIKIETVISKLTNEQQKEVLTRRYLLYQKWEQIAVGMCLDLRWVYRLHGRALQSVQKYLT
jgi:hypothetical protein